MKLNGSSIEESWEQSYHHQGHIIIRVLSSSESYHYQGHISIRVLASSGSYNHQDLIIISVLSSSVSYHHQCLRKIGVVCEHIFKSKLFFQCFLGLLSFFYLHFWGNISIYLRSFSIDVYAGKMPTKYMI